MTLEALKLQKEAYLEVIKNYEVQRTEITNDINKGIAKCAEDFFDIDEVLVACNGHSIAFHLKKDLEAGTLFQIYLGLDYSTFGTYKSLSLSYYSTNTQSDFEYNRLSLLGSVAEVLSTCKESLLLEINLVGSKSSSKLELLSDSISEARKELSKILDKISFLENKEKLYKLCKGVSFSKQELIYYSPKKFASANSMKIAKLSSSEKTATVEFTLDNRVTVVDKVKVENILYYVR